LAEDSIAMSEIPIKKVPLISLSGDQSSPLPGFLGQEKSDLDAFFQAVGERPSLRIKQIHRWLQQGVTDFQMMSDLPLGLRKALAAAYTPFSSQILLHSKATDETEKLLLEFPDKKQIETVMMREEGRATVCLSTQVGCGMGCVFCASGMEGVQRNLKTFEIQEELLQIRALLGTQERISHIVVMGMGEPLANLERLLPALDWASSPSGLGISARNITISTVGLPKKIIELAGHQKPYHLAVSLHAPNEGLRNQIVPTNEATGIGAILDAAQQYQKISGRQVTYEYILLAGVNDHASHAVELSKLLSGRQSHVNLIPFNPVQGLPWQRPDEESVTNFRETLRLRGVSATVRKRKGADIDAACGQLRREAARTLSGLN
jgi:23S rRNA (adenine2503-C2)-methyltransferase